MFAEKDLNAPYLDAGARIPFITPRINATRIALVTNLSWSANMPDNSTVGRVRLSTDDGRKFEFALRAGVDTSEWAHERLAAQSTVKHKLAQVALSYKVEDNEGIYEGHAYVTSFALPEKASIMGGSIEVVTDPRAEKLGLSVMRVSLIDESGSRAVAIPLRKQWLTNSLPAQTTGQNSLELRRAASAANHWRRIAEPGFMKTHVSCRARGARLKL
jgi:hypothetical protein